MGGVPSGIPSAAFKVESSSMTVFATHTYDNMTTKHRIIQVGSLAGSPSANTVSYTHLTLPTILLV